MPLRPGLLPPFVRRIPFTLALALTIFLTTAWTGTLVHPIPAEVLAAWGFGFEDVSRGGWLRLFLATFQILQPYMAVSMLATVLACVGACEARLGTVRTVVVYAVAHALGAVAFLLVARGFAALGSEWGRTLLVERGVGASGGAIGALGAWLVFLPPFLRRAGLLLCAIFLLVSFGGDVHPWDVSHVAAFLAGLSLGAVGLRRDARGAAARTRPGAAIGPDERRRAVAWIAAILGIVGLLTPFAVADHAGILRAASWFGVDLDGIRDALFATGAVLLLFAPSLRRGDRPAWAVTLAASVVAAVVLWQPGAPGTEHILIGILLVSLIGWRREFRLHAPPPPRRGLVRAAPAVPIAFAAYVAFGFVALRDHFVPPFDAAGAVREAVARLRLEPFSEPNWHSPAALWFLRSIPGVAGGLVLALLAGLARAVAGRKRAPGAERRSGGGAQSE
jgi:hypothetical protein